MRIIYHHRTRSTDAQRVHILEMVSAFQGLGHEVELVSLVPINADRHDAQRDAGNPLWQRWARRVPFAYEFVQLAYNLLGIPMLLRQVYRRKPEFLYERYSLFNFTGPVVSKILNVPLVLEVNSPFALEQGRDRDIRLVRFAAWTERLICNLATRVVVVSTPLARILAASGVRREKIDVMTNGVRLEHFRPGAQSPELRQSLGLEPGQKVIGFLGWFRKWHGIELLVDAFELSGLRQNAFRLMLIGDGQAMADLQAYVQEKKLGNSVIFTGPLPHEKVPAYLDLVDIAVQPAANEYCCPMKILEYMALGKPVVVPRQENIEEILQEGEEAEYFTPGNAQSLADALRKVAGDPRAAKAMGQHARGAITSRRYLWSANAQRVVQSVTGDRLDALQEGISRGSAG